MRDDFSPFGGSLVTAAEGPYHAASVGERGALYVLTKDYTTIEVWPTGFDGAVPRDPVQKLTLWGNTLVWVRCMTYHGGYLYLTDCGQYGVMRIDTHTGHVTRIAGREVGGCRDGAGDVAEFYHPWGVCVDRDGAIYIADNYNCRIRRIRLSSSLDTADDDTPMLPDNEDDISSLYVVDTIAGTGKQRVINGIGTEASFNLPLGIYVTPSRQLYISEQNSIRCVDLASAEFNVSTEVESLTSPERAKFLKKVTQRCARLRRDPSSLISPAHPYNPHGVAVASDGSIFINDYGNHRIVQILPAHSSPSIVSPSSSSESESATASSPPSSPTTPTPFAVTSLARAAASPTTPTAHSTRRRIGEDHHLVVVDRPQTLAYSQPSQPSAFSQDPMPSAFAPAAPLPPVPVARRRPDYARSESAPIVEVHRIGGGAGAGGLSPVPSSYITSSSSPLSDEKQLMSNQPTAAAAIKKAFDFSPQGVAPPESVEARARLVAGSGRLELVDGYRRGASIRDASAMTFDRCHSTLYLIDAGVLRVLEVQLDNRAYMSKVFSKLEQHTPLPSPINHLVIGYLVENYKFVEGVSNTR